MRERLGRAAIVATLLGTLLIPASGSLADPEDELDKAESQLEEVRGVIEVKQARAGVHEARAEALAADISQLQSAVAELDVEIAKSRSEIRTVLARIERTQAKIDAVQERATEQAVALYKSAGTETLDTLLDSRSLGELSARVELLGVAAQENTDALVEYDRLRVQIEQEHKVLYEAQEKLTVQRDALADTKAELEVAYAEHRSILAKLEAQIAEKHHEEEILEEDVRELERLILERSTLASVAALGKSDLGYIWPLNGAITSYYGIRWGRMHSGIDIDCVTGAPLVASLSGRVILASSYSGYGNAIIIDHGGGISTLYGHLSGFDVSSGQDVTQGAIVGYCGSTGNSTGDHLHFEVRVNGAPTDPLRYLP